MRRVLIFLFLFFYSWQSYSQEITLLSGDSRIYALNIENCNLELIVTLDRSFSDISFAPDGRFFGIDLMGELFEINLNTGLSTFRAGGFGLGANSLTISASDVAYITGTSGDVWSFNVVTGQVNNLGNLGREASGDLTFFNGNLYVATEGDNIVRVNLNTVRNSQTVIDENVDGDIFGVVSYAENCDQVETFAVTNAPNAIYRIDFDNARLTKICDLDISIFGGASTFEFFGSDPIDLLSVNVDEPSSCNVNDGTAEIIAEGGLGDLEYSLDGINYQSSNVLDNISFGTNSIFVRDQNECTVNRILSVSAFEINELSTFPARCEEANGSIQINIFDVTEPVMYSIDGGPLQTEGEFRNLNPGSYNISIEDGNGCVKDTVVNILQENCQVFIPNVFSPNGDNINDRFEVYSQNNEAVQIQQFSIYDRWGNQLYNANNFLINEVGNFWNGNVKNRKAPSGVYVYYLELISEEGSIEKYAGNVTLIR
jgi:gliding motility-associated-like protein